MLYIKVMLPTLVPLAAGYVLARWIGGGPQALRAFLRYVIAPALLFVVLLGGFKQEMFFKLLATGVAMGLAGYLLVSVAPKSLGHAVDQSAAMPGIICFTLPLLSLSWDVKQFGIRSAALLYVAIAATMLVAERRQQAGKALLHEPWAYAAAAALLFRLLEVSNPVLVNSIAPLAQAAYPLGLLYVGATLHPLTSSDFKDKTVWSSIAARWVAGFGVALLAVSLFKFTGKLREAVVIAGFAPPATGALFLASGEGGNRKVAAVGTLAAVGVAFILLMVDW